MTALSDHDTTVQVPTAPQHKPGDRVDITIKGVRIHAVYGPTGRNLTIDLGAYYFDLDTTLPRVAVETAVPANWPPQKRDVWVNQGECWFTVRENGTCVFVEEVGGAKWDVDVVQARYGPLTLAFRDGKAVQS